MSQPLTSSQIYSSLEWNAPTEFSSTTAPQHVDETGVVVTSRGTVGSNGLEHGSLPHGARSPDIPSLSYQQSGAVSLFSIFVY